MTYFWVLFKGAHNHRIVNFLGRVQPIARPFTSFRQNLVKDHQPVWCLALASPSEGKNVVKFRP